jgi:D-alanyl-D-alanine carboxypeptidase (penicillin-binding protein 5/6)
MIKDERRRQRLLRRFGIVGAVTAAAVLVLVVVLALQNTQDTAEDNPRYIAPETQTQQALAAEETGERGTEEQEPLFAAVETDQTTGFPESVVSEYGVLIDVEEGTILAEKGAHDRIVPASMTKILTVLVAAENIPEENLDDPVTITIDATDYSYRNGCSNVGFEVDEQVTVRDLFYGTILPSGADAAYSLAVYVAGSHEAFVEKMNEKLAEMGMAETSHVTNCVGLYDEDHYSTPYDIAMILKAAADIPFCREVLSTRKYTTSASEQHPEGLLISNWFLRRIEDRDTHGEVLCAKTGFVNQSGSCAASLAADENGKEYLCVTAGSTSSWRCIYDHVDIYDAFLPELNQE